MGRLSLCLAAATLLHSSAWANGSFALSSTADSLPAPQLPSDVHYLLAATQSARNNSHYERYVYELGTRLQKLEDYFVHGDISEAFFPDEARLRKEQAAAFLVVSQVGLNVEIHRNGQGQTLPLLKHPTALGAFSASEFVVAYDDQSLELRDFDHQSGRLLAHPHFLGGLTSEPIVGVSRAGDHSLLVFTRHQAVRVGLDPGKALGPHQKFSSWVHAGTTDLRIIAQLPFPFQSIWDAIAFGDQGAYLYLGLGGRKFIAYVDWLKNHQSPLTPLPAAEVYDEVQFLDVLKSGDLLFELSGAYFLQENPESASSNPASRYVLSHRPPFATHFLATLNPKFQNRSAALPPLMWSKLRTWNGAGTSPFSLKANAFQRPRLLPAPAAAPLPQPDYTRTGPNAAPPVQASVPKFTHDLFLAEWQAWKALHPQDTHAADPNEWTWEDLSEILPLLPQSQERLKYVSAAQLEQRLGLAKIFGHRLKARDAKRFERVDFPRLWALADEGERCEARLRAKRSRFVRE